MCPRLEKAGGHSKPYLFFTVAALVLPTSIYSFCFYYGAQCRSGCWSLQGSWKPDVTFILSSLATLHPSSYFTHPTTSDYDLTTWWCVHYCPTEVLSSPTPPLVIIFIDCDTYTLIPGAQEHQMSADPVTSPLNSILCFCVLYDIYIYCDYLCKEYGKVVNK